MVKISTRVRQTFHTDKIAPSEIVYVKKLLPTICYKNISETIAKFDIATYIHSHLPFDGNLIILLLL